MPDKPKPPKMVSVKLLRGCTLRGEPCKKGETVTVPATLLTFLRNSLLIEQEPN